MYIIPEEEFIRPGVRCVICTVLFDIDEEVALVTGTDEHQHEWTGVFKFPRPRCVIKCRLFSRSGNQKGRLCYSPFQCSNSSTFHPLCFKESRVPGTSRDLHLEDIWRFNSWARPWKTAPSLDEFEPSQPIPYIPTAEEVRQPTADEVRAVQNLTADEVEAAVQNHLWWRLHTLPTEIQQTIMNMLHGSLLWRIFAARNWREARSRLSGDLITASITDVKYWEKSTQYKPDLARDIITIAIHRFGIRSIKVSKSWPSTTSNQAKPHENYIVEKISDIHKLCLENQGSYWRFQKVNKPLRLWDTPAPPPFDSCRFKDEKASILRLNTIKLDTSLQGLSVFCHNNSTFGIYSHYTNNPSFILDIFNQIPLERRKTLIWLFCPLGQQQIKDVWLRHDIEFILPPILVLRTTRDQIYTFGPYRNSSDNFQYLGSTPSHIVSQRVPVGEAIPAFGIATEVSLELCESPELCCTSSPPPGMEGLYCCSAILEEVQYVTSYYMEGYCVGIMIEYSNGLQQSLGQCRPDAERHKVANPFGFHHLLEEVGGQRKEMVRLSVNSQEYQNLVESRWESTEINRGVTWLSWWFNNTSSFCTVIP